MDRFKESEILKKKTFTKKSQYDWYDWLINYIPKTIKTGWC